MEKIIEAHIYDPVNFIFKRPANERASFIYKTCTNFENCDAYKNGKCVLNNTFSYYCPYGKVHKEEGYTKKARNYYTWINKKKEQYKEEIANSIKNAEKGTVKIGDYIYLGRLEHLHNYVNSIDEELEIKNKYFLPIKNFTIENIKKLLNFQPCALMGGIITSYQEKNIPQFIIDLKFNFPNIWDELVKQNPKLSSQVENIDYIGKKAYVKTLAPGKVKFSIYEIEWNGEVLYSKDGRDIGMFEFQNCLVEITPTDKTAVEIADNNTVVFGQTVFVD